ncbi:MAG: chromate resistance protein, partial [Bacillati bacterium ANGP1]
MKWVTRKNAHVDRIACPWLIRRFVDREAEFVFVAADQVAAVAAREGAIPFAVESVELGHGGHLGGGHEDKLGLPVHEAPDEP